ncbi:hypothetical protein FF38_13627 [Lucilia cuprina]|uniref:Uncharacterized protein n=1 Tax=Lucilia cuprina TaxID=7375 RepID=A0A0L0CCG2_LUCCU|nr:hypothetical protein CVS40_12291 [Lucilia cuprina]KNC29149.1 hypothetical protein FF38_13627 [Lucilia cuprina]
MKLIKLFLIVVSFIVARVMAAPHNFYMLGISKPLLPPAYLGP